MNFLFYTNKCPFYVDGYTLNNRKVDPLPPFYYVAQVKEPK